MYYHDDIGVDVVRARFVCVPVIENHSRVVDCKEDTVKFTGPGWTRGSQFQIYFNPSKYKTH